MSKGEVGVVILGAMVLGNVLLGRYGRRWWMNSDRRTRQLAAASQLPDSTVHPLDPRSARLVVARGGGYMRDAFRLYAVIVDGHRVGKVAAGGSFNVDLYPGTHVVQIRIDGFRSKRITVECVAGSTVLMHCRPRDPSSLFVDDLALGIVGRRPWILLDRSAADPETT